MARRPAVTLIVPTLDEAATIGPLLAEVPPDAVDHVIIADGGSRDGTAEIVRAAGATVLEVGRGYGRACLAGAEAAADGILVFMDGDGSDRPDGIPALVGPIIAASHDFVIGSRARGERERGSMGWHQLAAGHLFGTATGLLYGTRYTDMGPCRAILRTTLLSLGMREPTYGWNLEMQMRAAQAGLRILEVPVRHRRRAGGRPKVAGSVSGTIRAGGRIAGTFMRVALARRRTGVRGAAFVDLLLVDPLREALPTSCGEGARNHRHGQRGGATCAAAEEPADVGRLPWCRRRR